MTHASSKSWAGNSPRGKRKRQPFNPSQEDIESAIKKFRKKGGKIEKLKPLSQDGCPLFQSLGYVSNNIFNWE